MIKRKSRRLSAVAAVVLCAALLSGCGSGAGKKQPAKPSSEQAVSGKPGTTQRSLDTAGGHDGSATPITPLYTDGRGAVVPWTEYEAEKGTYQGTLLSGSRNMFDLSAEASNRLAVKLQKNGDYVEWKTTNESNSIVVRNCIPDAPGGGGISATLSLYVNGKYKQKITLSSKYNWLYGETDDPTGLSNTPGDKARRYFDDAQALLNFTIPKGANVALKKDSDDTASSYIIDLIDLEEVGAPIAQPAGSLSVTSYGAKPNDGQDDTQAIASCITAAQQQGKSVYIPAGTFDTTNALTVGSNVTIQGAGMWYTKLNGIDSSTYVGFVGKGANIGLHDLSIFGDDTSRLASSGITGYYGTGSKIQNIWVEHTTTGAWLGASGGYTDNALVEGCRFRDTFADGINLCSGTSNTTVRNCTARNNGDDGFATWSADVPDDGTYKAPCKNNLFLNDTATVQWRANAFALYGGTGNAIKNCVGADTLNYGGLNISSVFQSYPFAGTTSVDGLTLYRCGGRFYDQNFGALWFVTERFDITGVVIKSVDIEDATYSGVMFTQRGGTYKTSATLSNITINGTGYYKTGKDSSAVYVDKGASGAATITGLSEKNIKSGVFDNASSGAFSVNGSSKNS